MPPSPEDADIKIGLIGMGDMGKMYARRLLQGGWSRSVSTVLPSPLSLGRERLPPPRGASRSSCRHFCCLPALGCTPATCRPRWKSSSKSFPVRLVGRSPDAGDPKADPVPPVQTRHLRFFHRVTTSRASATSSCTRLRQLTLIMLSLSLVPVRPTQLLCLFNACAASIARPDADLPDLLPPSQRLRSAPSSPVKRVSRRPRKRPLSRTCPRTVTSSRCTRSTGRPSRRRVSRSFVRRQP